MPAPSLAELLGVPSALLLQEVQVGVLGPESFLPELAAAAAPARPNLVRLAAAARVAAVPVIHTTAATLPGGFGANANARLFAGASRAGASNETGSQMVRPLAEVWADGDLLLPRLHGLSPLTGGPLDSLLRNAGVRTLVVTGVSVNIAITNVVFDAVNLGYQVVLVRDAVAGVPVSYAADVVRHTLSLPATLATTEEVVAAWAAAGTGAAFEAL